MCRHGRRHSRRGGFYEYTYKSIIIIHIYIYIGSIKNAKVQLYIIQYEPR